MTPAHFTPVPLDKSWRLMNHGPTVLVSARHGGITNVMAAAWASVLDYGQAPKVTVVLDKANINGRVLSGGGRASVDAGGARNLTYTCNFDRGGSTYDGNYSYRSAR